MSERTKGLLAVCPADGSVILDKDGRVIAMVMSAHRTFDEEIANARHLVACWNACEEFGLTTEQLEAGVLLEMVEVSKAIADACEDAGWHKSATAEIRGILAKIGGEK